MATIYCYEHDTTSFPVTVTAGGAPLDLTGHTLAWLVAGTRSNRARHAIEVSVHTAPASGESALTIGPADIVAMGGSGTYTLTGVDVDTEGREITRAVCELIVRPRPAIPQGS